MRMNRNTTPVLLGRYWYREDLVRRITALCEVLAVYDKAHPEVAQLANDRAAAVRGAPFVIGSLEAISEPAGRVPLLETENPAAEAPPKGGKPGRKRWTLPGSLNSGEYDERLQTLWAQNMTAPEIGKALRPERPFVGQAIYLRAKLLGLPKRGKRRGTPATPQDPAVSRRRYARPGEKPRATHLVRPIPEKIVAEHRASSNEAPPKLSKDELQFEMALERRCQRCPAKFHTRLVNKLLCNECVKAVAHIHR